MSALGCTAYLDQFTIIQYGFVLGLRSKLGQGLVRYFNEIYSRDVFTCAQSRDTETVSFTRHLGSVFIQPLCWRSV